MGYSQNRFLSDITLLVSNVDTPQWKSLLYSKLSSKPHKEVHERDKHPNDAEKQNNPNLSEFLQEHQHSAFNS